MIDILIYGLIGFIVLVAATFLFDKAKDKIQAAKLIEEQRKKDHAAWIAAGPPKPIPPPPRARPAPKTGTQTYSRMSKATMNGKTMTIQELQDFLNGRTTAIGKETDASLEEAMKDLDKAMADMDEIFKNDFFKRK